MSTTYESTSESGVATVDGVSLLPVSHEKSAESGPAGDAMASGSGGDAEAFDEVTGNLKQFTLFPKLPPELRDHIWKSTLEPRLVIIFAGSKYATWYPQLWGSNTQTPAIFSVYSGSRKVALREHKWLSKDASHRKIYFVPSLDTVYFKGQFDHCHERVSEFFGEAGSDIQILAIEHDWDSSPVSVLRERGLNFSRHKDLKELILVREYHMDVYPNLMGTSHCIETGGALVYRIDGLRSITVEEEFNDELMTYMLEERSWDHFNSGYIQENITDYLQNQENSHSEIRKDVGSPNGPLPTVKVLIEVVEEPNHWSLSVETRKRAEEEEDANEDLSALGILERIFGKGIMDAEISDEDEEEENDGVDDDDAEGDGASEHDSDEFGSENYNSEEEPEEEEVEEAQ